MQIQRRKISLNEPDKGVTLYISWCKAFVIEVIGVNKQINILSDDEKDLNLFCDNLDLQVDGEKVPRDAVHPHFPFNIPY